MSWQDRDQPDETDPTRRFGRPGGDWQGMRPSFDNPITWAVSLGRVSGIEVRVHILFLLFIVIELLRTLTGPAASSSVGGLDFAITAGAMAGLFVIVLAHEFGHCLACRWSGGSANEILMWPLGGLAYCQPANRWQAHMITVVGGPLVNVVICLLAGTMLGLITGRWLGVALPNPLTLSGVHDPAIAGSLPLILLFLINALSLILLLFNLLPIFPMDGGRIVQAALWPRFGYTRSMRLAVRSGYVGAILLGIFGAVMSMWMLVGIALFGGVTCYMTSRQLSFTEEFLGVESDSYALSQVYGDDQEQKPRRQTRADRRAERRARQEESDQAELDRILAKIADAGMDSLNARERRLLRIATERKRDE